MGGIGIGALAGPLLLARGNTDPRRPSYVFGPFVLRAVVDLVLATFTGLGLALGALIVYGLATSTGAVTFNSLLQAETHEGMRGRVFAGFDMAWQSGRLISLLLGGAGRRHVGDPCGVLPRRRPSACSRSGGLEQPFPLAVARA